MRLVITFALFVSLLFFCSFFCLFLCLSSSSIVFGPVTVVTHGDKLGTEEERREILNTARSITRRPLFHTFLVSNYTEESNDRSLETESAILDILHCALMEAEKGLIVMKQREKRKITLLNDSS